MRSKDQSISLNRNFKDSIIEEGWNEGDDESLNDFEKYVKFKEKSPSLRSPLKSPTRGVLKLYKLASSNMSPYLGKDSVKLESQ